MTTKITMSGIPSGGTTVGARLLVQPLVQVDLFIVQTIRLSN